ncbi:prepilin-type N-terminal cleavage/methylation domain-containing protein [Leptospira levettii]|uniref:prepilin-type N-terminal cleavage/methylation domain-containing protein n=1 Tax=Leptospira levettii TaxID=2023178 RepID=UPI001EEBCD05|nr:prepilin-type N-terminal cleavage/methylation domain-containing protein [Leptospira levettii]MCG6148885.1 type II secretion system GspH family protein [Leptospira levettii]MCW7498294.1 type II secretion system GspH family protein [Leptospira levettii]MCW7508924.1 type II secretion system GspH family protein [Leptospira levettii]MCW7520013.1 type II secretion system GspH family protein [Leptospira levettii]
MTIQPHSDKKRFPKWKRQIRDGLTLIEIVVVISILGLLMVIVGGSLRNLIIPSTEDISVKLQESFKFGYNKAQLTNQSVLFVYDFEKREYQFFLLKREESGLEEEPILKKTTLPFYSKIVSVRDLGGKPRNEGKIRIVFTPQGTTTDLFLYIGSDTEIKRTIQIYRYGGKIKIHKMEFFPEPDSNPIQKVSYGLDERDEQVDSNAKTQPR